MIKEVSSLKKKTKSARHCSGPKLRLGNHCIDTVGQEIGVSDQNCFAIKTEDEGNKKGCSRGTRVISREQVTFWLTLVRQTRSFVSRLE